jgi:hypothetical protein
MRIRTPAESRTIDARPRVWILRPQTAGHEHPLVCGYFDQLQSVSRRVSFGWMRANEAPVSTPDRARILQNQVRHRRTGFSARRGGLAPGAGGGIGCGRFGYADTDASEKRALTRSRRGTGGASSARASAVSWPSGRMRRNDFRTTSDSRRQVLKS